MKRKVITTAFLFSLSITAFAETGPAAEVVEKYDTAIHNRDLKAIMATFDKNATLFSASGAPMVQGEAALKSFFSKFFNSTKKIDVPAPATPKFQDFGNIVIRTGETTLALETTDGKRFSSPIRTTFVVKNDNGRWRIVHVHVSKENIPATK